jgi:GAF domain-containing protein
MDVVAENAARFCGATDTSIWRLEGESLRRAANHGLLPAATAIGGTITVNPRDVAGCAVVDRQTIHIEDVLTLPETAFPETQERLRRLQVPTRTMLATPLLREDVPIGVIVMRRGEVQPFTDKQIALAKTFAAQAVIAIENVRLFTELQEKNRAITEAHAQVTESLEQQTATAEILRVISRSPTNVQPVFDMIAESAARLCEAQFCFVYRFDGQLLHFVAHHSLTPEVFEINLDTVLAETIRAMPLRMGEGVMGRAAARREPLQVADIAEAGAYQSRLRDVLLGAGYRATLTVPLVREDELIGALSALRKTPGEFAREIVELLRTFGTQSVLATGHGI